MAQRSHLRITAWPGGRVDPPSLVAEHCEQDGEWLVYDPLKGLREVQVPDQAYLFELADVDGDDAAAVAALSSRLGRFTHLHRLDDDLPMNSGIAILRAAAIRGQDYDRNRLPEDSPSRRVHLAEVAYRLRALRTLTRHALAYRRGESVTEAWPEALAITTERAAWSAFTDYTNHALLPFHVRVWIDRKQTDGYGIGQTWPTAYEVAVLQLVNDLTTDAEFKVCAAEGCGRSFTRQRDRSVHGYSRTSGVVYCSRTCANSQTQREYRRRKRAERGQP